MSVTAFDTGDLRATLPPTLPVAKLVIGKPVEEVAALVPRVFNLCRSAQELAVNMALGLPIREDMTAHLAQDFARDHLVRLGIILPRHLGLDPLPIAQGADALLPDRLPETAADFDAFLQSDKGLGTVLRRLKDLFAPGEATAQVEAVSDQNVTQAGACENSVAARQSTHPLMKALEASHGRGPLWRAVARMLDLAACVRGDVPTPRRLAEGWVVVPASRGAYAMRAQVEAGVVTQFERVTPTDHMMAPGGIMAQSLASLPETKHAMAPLLVDVLDPCSPVSLRGGRRHA
ncbi:hydrogenase expression/formation protein HupK [Celeribacter naphthalenivorans]|uniref:hydrogenase expression/formation protein HupK n=1 Tax=Celeribacter naphthalenivorans TaxID=1614694 RepID=UPI001CFA540D|nr:hydrogenase expression/formation protein HupK [Celeribacter naphthalenivorans]